ncbi:MAG TPA: hypothetical protein VEK38_03150, partial [Candidatus Bathyarchaeia archaeon]|nr:hypothetical protein [Candidatus Bathyarchaeia archaeon]
MLSQGFIIKSYARKKNTYALIDQHHGHILCFAEKQWPVGTYMTYILTEYTTMHSITKGTLHTIPCDISYADLTFLHQIFELIFHAMPLGSCIPELFSLLLWLYEQDNIQLEEIWQKIFLYHICSILGLQPEQYKHMHKIMQKIIRLPIDRTNIKSLDLSQYHEILDVWISYAITEHIALDRTKTLAALIVTTGSYE